jgi:glucokinase
MTQAILVNGVPASGKTSVARGIGARLHVAVLSLDSVKEAFYEELGNHDGDREYGRALGRACIQAIWSLVADFPADSVVVVEAWFRLPPHDVVLRGLERAGIDRWVEVWCHAPAHLLAERYATRSRNPGHPPASYASELAQLAQIARPMEIGPCLTVDTTDATSTDLDGVADWIRRELELPRARP